MLGEPSAPNSDIPDRLEAQSQGRHSLADGVVPVAGHPAALVLLSGCEAPLEFAPRRFGAGVTRSRPG